MDRNELEKLVTSEMCKGCQGECDDRRKELCTVGKTLLVVRKALEAQEGYWIDTGMQNVYGGKPMDCSVCGNRVIMSPERFTVINECERFCSTCGARLRGIKKRGEL